ncbi:MAG: hypothetical protein LBM23_07285 [Propionibacteriaceae bacterium]|jgi:hypothetical protein|nr:hypothetical protein [Propionibacteriaceae bacterium]
MTPKSIFVVVVALVAVVSLVTGTLDVGHTLILAATLIAIRLIWPTGLAHEDALPALATRTRSGGRKDPSDLSWAAFDSNGVASGKLRRRLSDLCGDDVALRLVKAEIDTATNANKSTVLRWLRLIEQERTP